jgi:hypothetical protein
MYLISTFPQWRLSKIAHCELAVRSFTCGKCGTVLLHADAGQVHNLIIHCTDCGAYNSTDDDQDRSQLAASSFSRLAQPVARRAGVVGARRRLLGGSLGVSRDYFAAQN